jgi:hypothetical protein
LKRRGAGPKLAGMVRELSTHPVAKLFPKMCDEDFSALVEDIRLHGVCVPILVHGGEILDGRHRYKACQTLGIPCPQVEWDGADPWIEVQSRNLIRRNLGKDQIYAIRILASRRFPELVTPILDIKAQARQRKSQAKGQPHGTKALTGPQGPNRAADVIGLLVGMSGSTVKRVERLARMAPELIPKVAAGELSAKKALRGVTAMPLSQASSPKPSKRNPQTQPFLVDRALRHVQQMIIAEWTNCPERHRSAFLDGIHQTLRSLSEDHPVAGSPFHRIAG